MRTEYKRDMNHNYLILTGDERIDTDSYQVRMIVANAVPDLLQCRIQGIDGKFMVYYDITSRHSMTALFEEKKMDLESLQVILGGFIQIMEEMSEYLLNPCQLILEPEYIYLDAQILSSRQPDTSQHSSLYIRLFICVSFLFISFHTAADCCLVSCRSQPCSVMYKKIQIQHSDQYHKYQRHE